jgi:hypothetical protein
MEKESQNWSPCAKGNDTLLKSHWSFAYVS